MADAAESVLAKLKNKAKISGINYQQCLQLFFQEEFLRKLALSNYSKNFILKGGLFIYTLTNFESRATVDVDFLMRGLNGNMDYMDEIITEILCLDKVGEPLVAMHWEGRFSHMVGRYNSIYKVQLPKITPHVCRHTYCSIQAKAGMNPKTLQYLMGHSEIGVTLNTYTHLGLEDAAEELKRMEDLEKARKEIFGEEKEMTVKQNMFRVV